jgi:hypothetical protein
LATLLGELSIQMMEVISFLDNVLHIEDEEEKEEE